MGEMARAVLVTGSTSGIGLAIARAFGAAGWRVGVTSEEPPGAVETILTDIAASGAPEVRYFQGDLGEPGEGEAVVVEAIAQFGALDGLVNNAGTHTKAAIEDFPTEAWDRIRTIGLDNAFSAIRAAVPGMKARGWGRIINIASVYGQRGAAMKSGLVATKHALIGLTRSVALELAEHGVTVNAVCPGYVWTPLVEKLVLDEMEQSGRDRETVIRDVLLADQPTKRFITAEDVAALCVYLSGETAGSITGATLNIDGGWTAK